MQLEHPDFKKDSYPERDEQTQHGQWREQWVKAMGQVRGVCGGMEPVAGQVVARAALCPRGGRWHRPWVDRCLSSTHGLPMVLLSDDWSLCLFNKAPVGLPRCLGLGSGSSEQRKGSRSASAGGSPGSRGALSLLIHKHWTSIKIIKGNQQPINNINSRTGRIQGYKGLENIGATHAYILGQDPKVKYAFSISNRCWAGDQDGIGLILYFEGKTMFFLPSHVSLLGYVFCPEFSPWALAGFRVSAGLGFRSVWSSS